MVPLNRGVVSRGMVKYFSSPYRVISIFPEVNRNGSELGKIRFPPLLIVIDARGGRVEATENRGSAGTADWSRTVGVGECSATGRKSVEVRSVYFSRVATQEADPVVKIIDSEEKNIRAGRCGQ